MTALHRVKAYFGMVPADELDAYDGYEYDDDRHYDDRRRTDDRYDRYERYGSSFGRHDADARRDRYDADRYDADRRDGDRHESDRYGSERHEGSRYEFGRRDADSAGGAHAPRPRDARDAEAPRPDVPQSRRDESRRDESRRDESRRDESRRDESRRDEARRDDDRRDDDRRDDNRDEEPEVETSRSSRGRSWAHNTGPNHTSVRPTSLSGSRGTPGLTPLGSSPGGPTSTTRGALAVDAAAPSDRGSEKAPEKSAEPESSAPAEITSLQPTSYNEARVIGERYRDGIPVIMNLTDMDEVAAKRLVDFAAGLAFALRGSIEKVTNRVFLLSPPNVEVSAAERRKLAENSYTVPS